ncbi:MAG: hypothetical protein OXE52_00630 [Chloroflexi bacterium]|nr:hypothetical protein [Chloroflexota bacterium]
MQISEVDAASASVVHISVFLAYLITSLITYWKLIPRLSVDAKRLATILLATQIVAIALSILTRHASGSAQWVWRLNTEWNIPSTLASIQLSLVGGAALLAAWLADKRSVWLRMYLAAVGLLILFLAYDEYIKFHESIRNWPMYYAVIGAVVALASLALAKHSRPRIRIWFLVLIIGLSIAAIGAVLFERVFWECGIGIYSNFGICIERNSPLFKHIYVLEESLEFLGVWMALVAALGFFSAISPAPARRIQWTLYTLPLLWLLLLFQSNSIETIARQSTANGTAVEFESGEYLHGYLMNRSDNAIRFHLYISPSAWDFKGLGYSIHLVDQASLASVASNNRVTNTNLEFRISPGYMPVHRQWIEVDTFDFPPHNRALWVVFTLWRKEGEEIVYRKVRSSDRRLLSDTQVILDELVLPASSTTESTDPIAVFDNGFILQDVKIPEHVMAGSTLELGFAWRASAAGQEDYIQFLHVGREESGEWLVHDQQPLGARLPTRLWYDGLSDSEVWQVPVPTDFHGEYAVFSGLYMKSDKVRLNARQSDGSPVLNARVLLGSIDVQNAD